MLFLALVLASNVVYIDALLVDVVDHFLGSIKSFDRQLSSEFRWSLRAKELPSFLSFIHLSIQLPSLFELFLACDENLLRCEILEDLVLDLKKW